ncbi:MAG: hypothetical protein HY304_01115 [candidate division Zixibacteria bacterium]|nr:hypothetical protein [candidate division Zixibacteria bacterium]
MTRRITALAVIFAALTLHGVVNAQISIDTTKFSKAVPVTGDIPGLFKWANSRPSDSANVTIVSPKEGQRFKVGESLFVAVTATGVSLGAQTQYAELCGLANSAQGQHVHVIVDNLPYKADYADGKPFALGVPEPGVHTIRVFASRSWHESIKSPGSFRKVSFYVGDVKGGSPIQEEKPLLTYSRPKDVYEGEAARAILIDFFVSHATLSPDGYKVRLTIDGKSTTLTEWVPYLITGLLPGEHHFKLDLLDKQNKSVSGRYNSTERTITVK